MEYLGSLIVTLINIFDIDTVILGSSITAAREQLQAPLTRYVSERISARPMLEPHIYFSRVQRSSIIGGALRMFDLYIDGHLGTYAQLLERSETALRAFAPRAKRAKRASGAAETRPFSEGQLHFPKERSALYNLPPQFSPEGADKLQK